MIVGDTPNKERKVLADKISIFLDFNPKCWIKPFQQNNVLYLIKMGLFYHFLGLGMMFLGSNLISIAISDYESPQIPVSVSLAISAGFFEEIVFFGIPFYLSGNPYLILGTGIIWSIAHLFNTGVISIENLAYGGFLFSIPHIFFSVRTWLSGKGWFAICFHSGWNIIFLMSYCGIGLRQCAIFNDYFDLLNIIMASSSALIIYLAYLSYAKKKHFNRLLYFIPITILLFGMIFLVREEFIFLQ